MPIYINDKLLETFNFSGGECHVKVQVSDIKQNTYIIAYLNNSDDIMRLLLAIDAIRRINYSSEIHLFIPYFPYARQDRVCNPGESLSIKVMADIINSLQCASVRICDPHSDVTPALLQNCGVISLSDNITNSPLASEIKNRNIALVSPDAGAEKKVRELAKRLSDDSQKIQVFYASKVRDTMTGEIISTTLHTDAFNNVINKDLIIIDDICDGGRTFIELAKVLKLHDAKDIYLYVTHGIFSQGLELLKKHFSHIYCSHTMLSKNEINSDFLTVLSKY